MNYHFVNFHVNAILKYYALHQRWIIILSPLDSIIQNLVVGLEVALMHLAFNTLPDFHCTLRISGCSRSFPFFIESLISTSFLSFQKKLKKWKPWLNRAWTRQKTNVKSNRRDSKWNLYLWEEGMFLFHIDYFRPIYSCFWLVTGTNAFDEQWSILSLF